MAKLSTERIDAPALIRKMHIHVVQTLVGQGESRLDLGTSFPELVNPRKDQLLYRRAYGFLKLHTFTSIGDTEVLRSDGDDLPFQFGLAGYRAPVAGEEQRLLS